MTAHPAGVFDCKWKEKNDVSLDIYFSNVFSLFSSSFFHFFSSGGGRLFYLLLVIYAIEASCEL